MDLQEPEEGHGGVGVGGTSHAVNAPRLPLHDPWQWLCRTAPANALPSISVVCSWPSLHDVICTQFCFPCVTATWTKRSGSRLCSEVRLRCPPSIKKDFIVYTCDLNVSGLTSLWVIMRSHKYKRPKDSDAQPHTAYLGHRSSHPNPPASPATPGCHQVSGISLAPHAKYLQPSQGSKPPATSQASAVPC